MIDLPIWDYGWFRQCNVNNPEFLERDRMMTVELAEFLHEHGFLKRRMLEVGTPPPDDFAIKQSDLTEEGLAFDATRAIHNWAVANSDIRKPLSMRSLDSGLKKIKLGRQL